MKSSFGFRFILTVALLSVAPTLSAQVANDAWKQSYQAVQFGDQKISHDPITLVMPGVSHASGFGSHLENPASTALFSRSFGTIGLVHRSVSEETRFLNSSNTLSDNQTGVSNIGFLYQFPTVQGRLVWGAGYSQHSYYNRAMEVAAFNDNSTITDFFKTRGSEYADVAYNSYAIDDGDDVEDWDESILRVGFENYGDYLGIDQEAEILQRGMAGDYSTFLATEFQENLMLGVSLGLRSGKHTYRRTFMELDREGLYTGQVVDSSNDGEFDTDIDTILLNDELRSEFIAFSLRAGAIYRVGDHLHLGASYTFPSRLSVEEELDARIISTMNNGGQFEDDLRTRFEYTVRSPSRIHLGASLEQFNGMTVSLSGEYVDYSRTEVDFDTEYFEMERDENQFIADSYRSVWNLRGGMALDITEEITLRGGYGVRPSRFASGGVREDQFSVGFGFSVMEMVRLELGAQYSRWRNESSVVYSYTDYDYSPLPDEPPLENRRHEFADRDGDRLQVLATFQLYFR